MKCPLIICYTNLLITCKKKNNAISYIQVVHFFNNNLEKNKPLG